MATSFSRTVREEFRKYRLGPSLQRQGGILQGTFKLQLELEGSKNLLTEVTLEGKAGQGTGIPSRRNSQRAGV